MLKPFKSVFDLTLSDTQKFAAACLLAALLPVQGHAASALSKQGLMEQRVPQTESTAQEISKQKMLDQQRTTTAKPKTPDTSIGRQKMIGRLNEGAANAAATAQPTPKSDAQPRPDTMKGIKDAGQAKGTGAAMATPPGGGQAMQGQKSSGGQPPPATAAMQLMGSTKSNALAGQAQAGKGASALNSKLQSSMQQQQQMQTEQMRNNSLSKSKSQ